MITCARPAKRSKKYADFCRILPMARATAHRWVSLGEASALLGVNEATLRTWADRGRLRTFRTPGGHRRFSREDISSLVTAAVGPPGARMAEGWPESALDRMRRRLQRRRRQGEEWFQQFDEERRTRMRILGRRLVSLATDYITQKRRRAELAEEARYLGLEYGRELEAGNVKLSDAIAAFIYFRNLLHETIASTPGLQGQSRDRAELWNEVRDVEDAVLLAIAEAYQRV